MGGTLPADERWPGTLRMAGTDSPLTTVLHGTIEWREGECLTGVAIVQVTGVYWILRLEDGRL